MLTKNLLASAHADSLQPTGEIPGWDERLLNAALRAVYANQMPAGAPRALSDVLSSRLARLLATTRVLVHRLDGLPDWSASGPTLLIHARALEALLPKPQDDEEAMLADYRDNVRHAMAAALEAHHAFAAGQPDPSGGFLTRLSPQRLRQELVQNAGGPKTSSRKTVDNVLKTIGQDNPATMSAVARCQSALLTMDATGLNKKVDADTLALIELTLHVDKELQSNSSDPLAVARAFLFNPGTLSAALRHTITSTSREVLIQACLESADTSRPASLAWSDPAVRSPSRELLLGAAGIDVYEIGFIHPDLCDILTAVNESLLQRRPPVAGQKGSHPPNWHSGCRFIDAPLMGVVLAATLPSADPAAQFRAAPLLSGVPVSPDMAAAAAEMFPPFLAKSNPNLLIDLQLLNSRPIWNALVLSDPFRDVVDQACLDASQMTTDTRSQPECVQEKANGLRALLGTLMSAFQPVRRAGRGVGFLHAESVATNNMLILEADRVLALYRDVIERHLTAPLNRTDDRPANIAFDLIRWADDDGMPLPVSASEICHASPCETWLLLSDLLSKVPVPAWSFLSRTTSAVACPELVAIAMTETDSPTPQLLNLLAKMAEPFTDGQRLDLAVNHPQLRDRPGFKEVFERSALTEQAGSSKTPRPPTKI